MLQPHTFSLQHAPCLSSLQSMQVDIRLKIFFVVSIAETRPILVPRIPIVKIESNKGPSEMYDMILSTLCSLCNIICLFFISIQDDSDGDSTFVLCVCCCVFYVFVPFAGVIHKQKHRHNCRHHLLMISMFTFV